MVLLRIKDKLVKDLAISLAENALNELTPTGGKKHKRLTEPDMRKQIRKVEVEIHGESIQKKRARDEKEPLVKGKPQPPHSRNIDPLPESQPVLPVVMAEPEIAPFQHASGTESVPDRLRCQEAALHHKREIRWKPCHIPKGELISALTDQYLSEKHLDTLNTVIEKGYANDEIDAILWIVSQFREMQDGVQ